MAALHVARQAIAEAGWSAADLEDAVLFLGTSRGTADGWVDPWPQRRAFPLMAASNSLHSEPAAAISIELGIRGPWQVLDRKVHPDRMGSDHHPVITVLAPPGDG